MEYRVLSEAGPSQIKTANIWSRSVAKISTVLFGKQGDHFGNQMSLEKTKKETTHAWHNLPQLKSKG